MNKREFKNATQDLITVSAEDSLHFINALCKVGNEKGVDKIVQLEVIAQALISPLMSIALKSEREHDRMMITLGMVQLIEKTVKDLAQAVILDGAAMRKEVGL